MYRNWWAPPDEIITIKPSDEREKQRRIGDSKAGKAETVSVLDLLIVCIQLQSHSYVRKQRNRQRVPFNTLVATFRHLFVILLMCTM